MCDGSDHPVYKSDRYSQGGLSLAWSPGYRQGSGMLFHRAYLHCECFWRAVNLLKDSKAPLPSWPRAMDKRKGLLGSASALLDHLLHERVGVDVVAKQQGLAVCILQVKGFGALTLGKAGVV